MDSSAGDREEPERWAEGPVSLLVAPPHATNMGMKHNQLCRVNTGRT